jgi:DNA-binding HxlR family transcriptional regulator
MGSLRSYEDACGMAHALDLVGERWALLVVRELVLGPKRFSDLKTELPGISTNVLSHRLDELEVAHVIQRRHLPPPAASWVYELTEWGRELEPIMRQLGRWGARSPAHRPDLHLSVASFVLSLRTNFDPEAARHLGGEFELRLDEEVLHAQIGDGRFRIDPGSAARPAAVITSTPHALALVIYAGRDLGEAVSEGEIRVEGDQAAGERFLRSFTLPEPACGPAD